MEEEEVRAFLEIEGFESHFHAQPAVTCEKGKRASKGPPHSRSEALLFAFSAP